MSYCPQRHIILTTHHSEAAVMVLPLSFPFQSQKVQNLVHLGTHTIMHLSGQSLQHQSVRSHTTAGPTARRGRALPGAKRKAAGHVGYPLEFDSVPDAQHFPGQMQMPPSPTAKPHTALWELSIPRQFQVTRGWAGTTLAVGHLILPTLPPP